MQCTIVGDQLDKQQRPRMDSYTYRYVGLIDNKHNWMDTSVVDAYASV